MTDTSFADETVVSASHDHAWRRRPTQADTRLIVGEYACDLCPATWSM